MCDSTRTQGKDNQYLTGFPLRFLFGATKIQSTWTGYCQKQERIKQICINTIITQRNLENGKITCMPEDLLHICEIFDVTTDYFYFGERIEKSKKEDITSVNAEIYAMLDICSPKELKK